MTVSETVQYRYSQGSIGKGGYSIHRQLLGEGGEIDFGQVLLLAFIPLQRSDNIYMFGVSVNTVHQH